MIDAYPLVAGGIAGFTAGCSARCVLGYRSDPLSTGNRVIRTAGGLTATWWIITYPIGSPGLGSFVVGSGVGYMLGQLAGSVIVSVRALKRDGNGDDEQDDGGNGGDGGWKPPIQPIGPGPALLKINSPVVVSLSMADFNRECATTPAPAEPVLIPVGK